MNDENTTSETTEETPAEETPAEETPAEESKPEKPPVPAAVTLLNEVKEKVRDNAGELRGRIVDELAKKEEDRRADILHGALVKRKTMDAEIKKIKPTFLTGVDQETGKETLSFTKKEIEERKKKLQKLAKLDKLIGEGFEKPSADVFGKLKDFK
jgi:hypothetical protein